MRILVTGDPDWSREQMIRDALEKLNPSLVIHGGGIGAEWLAGKVAKKLGIEILAFPVQRSVYGNQAGVIKNQEMLDQGRPNIVLAFFTFTSNIKKYREPADILRKAKAARLPVLVFRGDVDETCNPTRF